MIEFEYNDENLAKIRKVGEALMGTCNALDDALADEFGEGTEIQHIATDLLHELDDITMTCESCGWWCESGEFGAPLDPDNSKCADCRDDE